MDTIEMIEKLTLCGVAAIFLEQVDGPKTRHFWMQETTEPDPDVSEAMAAATDELWAFCRENLGDYPTYVLYTPECEDSTRLKEIGKDLAVWAMLHGEDLAAA